VDRAPPLANYREASPHPAPQTAPATGSLLYLGTLGAVAACVGVAFFGTGLSLLAPSPGDRALGSAGSAATVIQPSVPSRDGLEPLPQSTDTAQNFATLREPSGGRIASADDLAHQRVEAETLPPISRAAGMVLATAGAPPSNSAGATAPVPARPASPAPDTRELLKHGDALLRTGDLASARLFYERAANAGDGRAALRLGATFDPAFFGRLGGKVHADAAVARTWYRRALDLGAVEAQGQLNSLETRQGTNRQ